MIVSLTCTAPIQGSKTDTLIGLLKVHCRICMYIQWCALIGVPFIVKSIGFVEPHCYLSTTGAHTGECTHIHKINISL